MPQRLDYATLAAHGMKALAGVHAYIGQSGLPKSLIDLVYLRVSQINGCAYCIDTHSRDLLKSGLAIDKLVLVPVFREAGNLFTDQERAALAWAESVTRVSETHVPDADFQAVAAHFTEKELADLTLAVALMNTYNRMAITFRTPPDALKPKKTD